MRTMGRRTRPTSSGPRRPAKIRADAASCTRGTVAANRCSPILTRSSDLDYGQRPGRSSDLADIKTNPEESYRRRKAVAVRLPKRILRRYTSGCYASKSSMAAKNFVGIIAARAGCIHVFVHALCPNYTNWLHNPDLERACLRNWIIRLSLIERC